MSTATVEVLVPLVEAARAAEARASEAEARLQVAEAELARLRGEPAPEA